jgi:cytoskeletal protein CcmA (bactofilin family)
MKKTYFVVVSLLTLVLAAALVFVPSAHLQTSSAEAGQAPPSTAAQPASEQAVPVGHEDYLNAGETIDVKTEGSSGDVVVAGANVKISGPVQGYVMAAGANVSIDAAVGNDLWAAGANVNVNAPVSDTVMLAGSSVSIQKDATIGGNAKIAGSTVDILGKVTKNLNVASANARLASEVGGNADIRAERVVIDPGAVIRGRLTVYSPNEPVVSPGAQVIGGLDYHHSESSSSPSIGGWLTGWLLRFVWLTVLGLFAIWFSSVWTNRIADTLKQQTGRAFLTGLIAVIAAPILCILLLVTIIGLPLGVVLGGMSIVALILSSVFVAYFIGGWITSILKQWETSDVAKVLLGALAVSIVIMLPWIGGFAKLIIVIFGVGALIIERRDLFRTMRSQGLA